ncbi:MAG: hypothetical protein HQL11_01655 [Candidatus Omnitrophica bacterium]|nr:hypothetical protein [Candidatus Omnitrophota bacterium]
MLEFIRECRDLLPRVTVTAVGYPEFDVPAFETFVAKELRVPCRVRPYDLLGGP